MNAMSLAQMTGFSAGKKKTSRGSRTRSTKPGADHLGALQRAHAAGDFKAAKIHALNYAKSAHQHGSSDALEESAETAADTETNETPVATVAQSASSAPNPSEVRARLAKLAMSRKK